MVGLAFERVNLSLHRAGGAAWEDGNDPDVIWVDLDSQAISQGFQRTFTRRIKTLVGRGVKRGRGVDEHDLAFGFLQQRKKFAGNDERSADIDVEQPVKIHRSCALDFARVKCTRGVNQNIEPARCFTDKLGEFLDACFVRKVGSPADRARAAQRGCICQFFRIPARKTNLGAVRCEGLRGGLASATTSASHQSCLIFHGERRD